MWEGRPLECRTRLKKSEDSAGAAEFHVRRLDRSKGVCTKMTTGCRRCATVSSWITIRRKSSLTTVSWLAVLAFPALMQGAAVNHELGSQLPQVPAPSFGVAPTPGEPAPASRDEGQFQDEDVQVLMRGPLHEAFASLHQDNPAPGPVIDQRPPDSINEALPEYKPEGQNIQWIPGYWDWDDEGGQFIWISGLWRDIPLGQRWVPGYWEEVRPGYRRVSGFWTRTDVDEIAYLPAPPASLDVGPSSAPPGEQYFYTPGNWVYRFNVYQWQPGYWQPYIENWVWVPAHYVWTPCGYVFCAGYWDRLFQDRGVCFAPVRFIRPIYYGPQFYYRPVCRIVTGIGFYVHLFVRPNCGRYYYGDWYGDPFAQREFCAWIHYPSRYRCYDPLYSYYRCSRSQFQNTLTIDWIASQHQFSEKHADYRPRHVYKTGFDRDRRGERDRLDGGPSRIELVEDFEQSVARAKDGGKGDRSAGKTLYRRLNEVDRQVVLKDTQPLREIERSRRLIESQQAESASVAGGSVKRGKVNDRAGRSTSEIKMKLPKAEHSVVIAADAGGHDRQRFDGRGNSDTKNGQMPTLSASGDRSQATKLPNRDSAPNGAGQGDPQDRSKRAGGRPPKQNENASRVLSDNAVPLPGTQTGGRRMTEVPVISDAPVISDTRGKRDKSDSGNTNPKRIDQNTRQNDRVSDPSRSAHKLEVPQIDRAPQVIQDKGSGVRGDATRTNRSNKSDDKGASRQDSIRPSAIQSDPPPKRGSGQVDSFRSSRNENSQKIEKQVYRSNQSENGIAERARQIDSQRRRQEDSGPKVVRPPSNSGQNSPGQRNREVNSNGSSSDSNRGSESKRGRDKPGKD